MHCTQGFLHCHIHVIAVRMVGYTMEATKVRINTEARVLTAVGTEHTMLGLAAQPFGTLGLYQTTLAIGASDIVFLT